jgi:hypothetical protein
MSEAATIRTILNGGLKGAINFKEPLQDGMVARIFCEKCGRIKQIPPTGLEEVLAIRGNQTVMRYHQGKMINWKKAVIVANQCFDVSLGGRVSFRSHCNGQGGLRLKIIEI